MVNLHHIMVAWKYRDVHAFAALMVSLAAEFLEGYNERARRQFNCLFNAINDEMRQAVIDALPWERVAIDLASKNGLQAPFVATKEERCPGVPKYVRVRINPAFLTNEEEELMERLYTI